LGKGSRVWRQKREFQCILEPTKNQRLRSRISACSTKGEFGTKSGLFLSKLEKRKRKCWSSGRLDIFVLQMQTNCTTYEQRGSNTNTTTRKGMGLTQGGKEEKKGPRANTFYFWGGGGWGGVVSAFRKYQLARLRRKLGPQWGHLGRDVVDWRVS